MYADLFLWLTCYASCSRSFKWSLLWHTLFPWQLTKPFLHRDTLSGYPVHSMTTPIIMLSCYRWNLRREYATQTSTCWSCYRWNASRDMPTQTSTCLCMLQVEYCRDMPLRRPHVTSWQKITGGIRRDYQPNSDRPHVIMLPGGIRRDIATRGRTNMLSCYQVEYAGICHSDVHRVIMLLRVSLTIRDMPAQTVQHVEEWFQDNMQISIAPCCCLVSRPCYFSCIWNWTITIIKAIPFIDRTLKKMYNIQLS